MLLLNFLRFLRGYVLFEVDGSFIERFLNLAARARIPVWDARRAGGKFYGYTDASSYSKLRQQAKKAGVRIRLSDKKGLPFTRKRYRKRRGLLIGAAVFFAFIFLMSQFIWRIEINGSETIPESRIIDALHDIGISPGSFRWRIDVRDGERRILLKVPELSWAALNIGGSTLRVEVDERTLPPAVIDPHDPCNVVAKASGQITAMNVFDGQGMVKVGDAVLKGDILISGITRDKQEQNLFKHARGEVFARCEFDYEIDIPLQQTHYVETGDTKDRTYLDIFGFDLPLFLPLRVPAPYHVERRETPVTFFTIQLPFSTLTETYYFTREEPVILTEEEAKEQALLELGGIEEVYLEGGEILERTLSGSLESDRFLLSAHYDCIVDIAEQRQIYRSEDGSPETSG